MEKKKTKPYKKVEGVEVSLWGNYVGAIALDPSLGFYVFAYDPNFLKRGIELSPIHLPLREDPYVFTSLPIETYQRLPALFADSLPDDFGNALINRYMAEKGLSASQVTALDRLAYMGTRSMGAFEFKPVRGPRTKTPTALDIDSLIIEARKAVSGSFASDDHANAVPRSIIDVGTSAGGARAKAVIAWNSATNEIRSGQVDVPEGFEHWLLKFDGIGKDNELGSSAQYGRIEYAYYLMAREAGIAMSESRLFEENGRAHFMTKRFDRGSSNRKHHIQSLCAMDHLDYKKKSTNSYEQLFLTIRKLAIGHDAEVEAFRRLVFNIIGRNCDDHTKNFSFLLREGINQWELAPAYDIIFAHNPAGEWTHQHLMSVNGKFKDFTGSDLLKLADRFGLGEGSSIIKNIGKVIERWPEFAATAGILNDEARRIGGLHLKIK
jgi:serine/threonine-protein kinase HipA